MFLLCLCLFFFIYYIKIILFIFPGRSSLVTKGWGGRNNSLPSPPTASSANIASSSMSNSSSYSLQDPSLERSSMNSRTACGSLELKERFLEGIFAQVSRSSSNNTSCAFSFGCYRLQRIFAQVCIN